MKISSAHSPQLFSCSPFIHSWSSYFLSWMHVKKKKIIIPCNLKEFRILPFFALFFKYETPWQLKLGPSTANEVRYKWTAFWIWCHLHLTIFILYYALINLPWEMRKFPCLLWNNHRCSTTLNPNSFWDLIQLPHYHTLIYEPNSSLVVFNANSIFYSSVLPVVTILYQTTAICFGVECL